jgi:hypothetical protein
VTLQKAVAPPERQLPDASWEHLALYQRICAAIASLPAFFRTETKITGILATDLHKLTVLDATIEEQVVRTLNLIRTT